MSQQQLDLLNEPLRPLASQPKSPTSQAAALEAEVFADQQRVVVYDFIRSQGRWGATRKELEVALGISGQSLCFRLWELRGGPRVNGVPKYRVRLERTGERRERCDVYRVAL